MKRWALGALVIVGLAAAALVLRGRNRLPETPEDAVSEFFKAAGRGDRDAYLRLTCGELLRSLEQSRRELGPAAFRESLKRSVKDIRGLGVLPSDRVGPEGVWLEVEIIYEQQKRSQQMLLVPKANGWAIAAVETARPVPQEIPWGTPVFEEPPQDQTTRQVPTAAEFR